MGSEPIGLEGGQRMAELDGALALVTGAAGRIGRATALALASAGARVVASDIDLEGLDATAGLLGGNHVSIPADLATVPAVEALVDSAAAALGGLDILVNVAADLTPGGTITEATPEHFDRAMAINARAPFFAVRAAIPHLLARGGGSIVNVASILGLVGLAGFSPYAVSKITAAQLTRQVTVEYADQGIRCNAVCPGATITAEQLADEGARAYVDQIVPGYPVARVAAPEEIAAVIRFLAGPGASFMNGAIVPVDGGYTSR